MNSNHQELFLYLICHDRNDIKTHTYIGCVSDFNSRLAQHNGQIPGGPRITRRAAGSWFPVLILKLPEKRSFNSKVLKREWKQSSRGLESRVKKGLMLACEYNLSILIQEEGKNSFHIIQTLQKFLQNSKTPGRVKITAKEWEKLLNTDS